MFSNIRDGVYAARQNSSPSQDAHFFYPVTITIRKMSYPNFLTSLISFKSTLLATAGSTTFNTASTAIGESMLEYCDTTCKINVTSYCNEYVNIS